MQCHSRSVTAWGTNPEALVLPAGPTWLVVSSADSEFTLSSLEVVDRCYPGINLPDKCGIHLTFWVLMNW